MTEQTQPLCGVHAFGRMALSFADGRVGPRAPVDVRLVCAKAPSGPRVFDISGPSLRIGRAAECDVRLDWDPTVSRRHARVVLEETGHVLYDEASANGTWVNGAAVSRHVLARGDEIQVGGVRLTYE